MRASNSLPRIILVLLTASALILPAAPAWAAAPQDLSLMPGCVYGYTLQPGPPWVEIQTTGTQLFNDPQTLPDDLLSPALNLGFSFPFFESTYASVSVSTNGFLIFMNNGDNAYPNNYAIPAEYPPNNIIAGFWDDLTVGGFYNSGAAYFQAGNSTDPAVVEWKDVTRLGKTDTLTFEILLYPNGDIAFIYGALNGVLDQSTVGFEDKDGVDGCQLLYHSSGLASGQSYRLIFPASGYRVKSVPAYLGGFLANGKADFPFDVVNTGTAADSFSFQTSGSGTWSIAVIGPQGQVTSTPSLAAGEVYHAVARVKASQGASIGNAIQGQLDIVSQKNPTKKFTVRLDAAIPAPFATFYVDSSAAYLRFVMPDRQVFSPVFPGFSGRTLGITRIAGWNYLVDWEYLPPSIRPYGNIQTAVETPWGYKTPAAFLFDHAGEPTSVYDQNASTIVGSDGSMGVAFVRYYPGSTSHIYFARLNSNGQLLTPAVKLPGQTDPAYYFTNPVISALPDNHFAIVYERSGNMKDIAMTIIDQNGVPVPTPPQPQMITDSQATNTSYFEPVSARMLNGETFLAYLSQSGTEASQLEYRVRHSNGSIDPAQSILNVGGTPYAAVLNDGTILVAWLRGDASGVQYALFDKNSGANILPAVRDLPPANNGKIDYVSLSLTGDIYGNAVITWTDQAGYYLYYALVGPDGSILTPPMVFLRASNPTTPNLIYSSTGRGVAPLDLFWSNYVPSIRR